MKFRRSERAQLGDNTPPQCRASERVAYDSDAANSERIKVTTKSNDSYTKTEHNYQQIVGTCLRHVQAQWKITGACIKLLPNRGWNQKQKHKKTALEQRGMLRIWRCDCALCVIGNEFPCRQPHNPSATLLRGPSTLPQG